MSLDNPHACYWCSQQPCKGGSGNGSCQDRPAPSPQPEMPEGWEFIDGEFGGTFLNEGLCKVMSIGRIKQLLATQGLHVIDGKQQAVLDACAAMTLRKSKSTRPPFLESVKGYGGGQGVVDAEWALRAAKEGTNG